MKNWVSRITASGGNTAIIVLVNQIDVNPSFGFENEQELKAEFPQIKYFLKTSSANGQGIDELKKCLAELIPQAELFNTQIDERWFPVKEQLQQETGAQDFLNESRFRQICGENGISEKEGQKELIHFLNDLGIVLHFDNKDLAEYFVLDPYWLTYGIYQIITSQYVAKNEGIIELDQMEYVINEEKDKAKAYRAKNYRKIKYSTNERRYLLDFMAEYKLVFYSHCRTKVIIPDVLTTAEPNEITQPIRSAANKIQFVYSYSYLPKSVLPNFMADTSAMLCNYWRTGCVLEQGTESALVSAYDNRITIMVSGVHKQKRAFLAVIRSYLENINANQNQKPKRLIPLPDIKNAYVSYDELLRREKRESTYYYYGEVEAAFEISKLLDGIIQDKELQKMILELKEMLSKQNFKHAPIGKTPNIPKNSNTKKIFISYSIEDVEIVESKLIRSLRNLERQGKITIWYDKNLQAGEEWNPEIKRQLQQADIILFIVSLDFIATDYIWDVEIENAIKRHEKGEVKVIPIILSPCDWSGDATPFSKLQVVPTKGKPITTFKNQDEAWLEVLQAIKKVIS